ncbi:hypothetical protein [Marinirhabdus gelatinilytica]|uniref:hypothetical protein n=1 Tax=Marinirhabdus gelatinilytica TaxID=1703343 RepID=UPI0011C028B2|nr:hypothetical protein [Marinirhabdus gelatinilytica]
MSVLLLLASVTVHYLGNYPVYRLLRGVISFTFLAILFSYHKKNTNPLLATFLILYGTSSVITIWYENATLGFISLILNFIAYLFLIRAVWLKATFKNLGIALTLVFIVLIIINAYLLYEFITMMRDFANGGLNYASMLLGAMALVVVSFLALLYNHTYNSKPSLVFTIAVFMFVFAEIFRAIGYYGFGFDNIPVYIARILLILGSGMIVHFALMPKKNNESLSCKLL